MKPPKRLRVLQISHDYQGPFRTVCRQYASAFHDHDVLTLYVCGKHDADVALETGGDEVLFLEQPTKAMRGLKLGTLFKVARLFRQRKFDLVIAHRYKPIYFAGVMSLFHDIPVLLGIVHEHGVFKRINRRLFVRLWRRNIICVGVSESVSRNIERYCGALASQGRLFTLPHAIDMEKAARLLPSAEAKRTLGMPQDAFCFGTIGRLVAKKDHHVLLAAFCKFLAARRDEQQNTMLAIVGAGPLEASLREYVAQHGMAHRVMFTGHVPDAWRFMKAIDFFVLPSGPAEAFGMVLLEAMLACVPMISSDAPGPVEVVGDAAIRFAMSDANDLAVKLALARDMSAQERERLAASARKRLERQFTLAAFSDRLWGIPELRALAGTRE